jgi:hypothetical protein
VKGTKLAKPKNNDAPRSKAIDVESTPDNRAGNAVLAAWRGIYQLFGGRAKFRITPEGVQVSDFSVLEPYDPEQIVKDIGHKNRRLDLYPLYGYITGEIEPEDFTDPKEITQYTVQFWRDSVDEGSARSPKYVRDATSNWKSEHNMAKKRGPRKKIFRLDEIESLDEAALGNVDPKSLEALKEMLERVVANQNSNNHSESTESATEAETATA